MDEQIALREETLLKDEITSLDSAFVHGGLQRERLGIKLPFVTVDQLIAELKEELDDVRNDLENDPFFTD